MAATDRVEGTAGLDASFAAQLKALIAASGGKVKLMSGYRTPERQEMLFAAAVKKYGSAAAASKWVAPPGKSNHNKGLAADLGGDLALAAKLAPQFGLYRPMTHEPWHFEPIGHRGDDEAYTPTDDGTPMPDLAQTAKEQALNAVFGEAPNSKEMFGMGSNPAAAPPTAQGAPTPSNADLVSAAQAAGFSGSALRTALAIALAESRGDPKATGKNKDGSLDRGFWQINNKWHPDVTDDMAYDPMQNAQAAFRISGGGTNWKPWTTYKTGAYKQYLSQADQLLGGA